MNQWGWRMTSPSCQASASSAARRRVSSRWASHAFSQSSYDAGVDDARTYGERVERQLPGGTRALDEDAREERSPTAQGGHRLDERRVEERGASTRAQAHPCALDERLGGSLELEREAHADAEEASRRHG